MPNDPEQNVKFEQEKEMAEECVKKEKFDEAISHYRKALDLNPEYAEGYCNLGSILLDRGEFSEAEAYLQKSIIKDENLVEAYFNLGCSYQEKGDFNKALSFYKEVVLRERGNTATYARMGACAHYLGRTEDAVVFLKEALRLQPNSLEAAAQLSSLHIERKEYPEAEDALRISLVSHPEVVSLHFTLGLVLKEQGKFESALAQFNKVVTLEENNAEGFYHLADCCVALDLLKQAEPFYAKAFKLDQTFADPLHQLGNVYEKMDKSDSAAVMYRQWLAMVEDESWQYDENQLREYQRVCSYVEKYLSERGKDEEAEIYRKMAESPEVGLSGEAEESSLAEVSDYRVSLQIDE